MSLPRLLALAATLWLALLAGPLRAQQAVPVLSDRVIDQAGWLQPAQHQALVERLARLEREQGTQLVVLLLPSTAPEDIAAYAQRVADSWKLGRREVGDGLLLVVATQDRRVRLEVAKALEGAIPDLAARRVIDEAIVPAFRRGEPAAGLLAAVDRVQALVQGEGLPPPASHPPGGADSSEDDPFGLAVIALVALPLVATVLTRIAGRRLGPLASAALVGFVSWDMGAGLLMVIGMALLALLVALVLGALAGRPSVDRALRRASGPAPWIGSGAGWPGGGWSSGGGGVGGDSGGGFSAGGGGDFGGGGASGDW